MLKNIASYLAASFEDTEDEEWFDDGGYER